MRFKLLQNPTLRLFLVVLVASVSLAGCRPGGGVPDREPPPPNLHLKSGDTLVVQYSGVGAPQPFTTRVSNDGTVSVPPSEVGSIVAAGKRVEDFEQELQNAINRFYKQLTVTVEDVRYIYISGEVKSEGKIQNQEDLTLLKAIAAARGFTTFANRNRILLIREGETYFLDAKKAERDPRFDFRVYPGDQLTVQRRIF